MPTLEALHAEVQALKRRIASLIVGVGGGAPAAHAASHQNGGADEISVAGLSGLLADGQTPLAHATNHHSGGSDPLALGSIAGSIVIGQVPNDLLTNAKLANMTEGTIKGRALGAGTGDTTDLTAAQAKAIIAPQLEYSTGAGFGVGDVGKTLYKRVPGGFNITLSSIVGDISGSALIEVETGDAADVAANTMTSITGGNEPELTSDKIVEDSTLTGWTLSIPAGNWLAFTLVSASTLTHVHLELSGTRV